ncbi:hypothetical protein PanWU01x14_172270 [Parasponia andersonii]|uniref:Uncharacterized protein n=1 Tax=Parasponia andersonii TaxID=3476 RepID=A0A2P5C9F6_PARAD|nr:hypothetical protein PanWU01x14_172270 [Parasponia andersonii]
MVSVPVTKEVIPEPELGESCQGQLRCLMSSSRRRKCQTREGGTRPYSAVNKLDHQFYKQRLAHHVRELLREK